MQNLWLEQIFVEKKMVFHTFNLPELVAKLFGAKILPNNFSARLGIGRFEVLQKWDPILFFRISGSNTNFPGSH